DDGRLTDNQGHVVSFKNVILIMTSNIGAERILELSAGITESNRAEINRKIRDEELELVKRYFRPEFINRVDEIITFHALDRSIVAQIARIQFARLQRLLDDKDITATLTDAAANQLAEYGYDPSFGARPLKRAVNKELSQKIAREMLNGNIKPGMALEVDAQDGEIIIRASEAPAQVVRESRAERAGTESSR
ncbi:MAG TPA: AAA family ATPase, partial [candidate division Zixibacteria bacterium]|nr:AAA family ATPase [candidate division Zixibacteria bacterium]